jgi:SNF2 family DNA or RNA helicase
MCRSPIVIKELVYINNEDNKDPNQYKDNIDNIEKDKKEEKLSKQDKVLQLVVNGLKQNKKFLIFSMYDESFNIIRRVLDNHNIDFVEISGSKATRDSKLKKFKENKINVVFLNSRFNGAGINLENATDIILYHEMPSGIRDQVIGRALRIGRRESLTIHNLIF